MYAKAKLHENAHANEENRRFFEFLPSQKTYLVLMYDAWFVPRVSVHATTLIPRIRSS